MSNDAKIADVFLHKFSSHSIIKNQGVKPVPVKFGNGNLSNFVQRDNRKSSYMNATMQKNASCACTLPRLDIDFSSILTYIRGHGERT
jgi:hypothetical protein